MEMYGIEIKVDDKKTQEPTKKTIVNQQKPPTTKEKTVVNTLTFEDLKQLIKRYKFIKSKISKLGELVVEVDGTNLFYVAQRKYGLAFQINNIDHWITQRVTTKEQLQNKVDIIKRLHEANKDVLQARQDLVG